MRHVKEQTFVCCCCVKSDLLGKEKKSPLYTHTFMGSVCCHPSIYMYYDDDHTRAERFKLGPLQVYYF